jgi:hypothetical protein
VETISRLRPLVFEDREGAKLIVADRTPHGMPTTLKERINAELLAFSKA